MPKRKFSTTDSFLTSANKQNIAPRIGLSWLDKHSSVAIELKYHW